MFSNPGFLRYKKLRAIFKSLNAGSSITAACSAANISVVSFWTWRQKNERLDSKVNKLTESRVQMVEDANFQSALKGNVAAQCFYLCNRRPNRWHNVSDIKNIIINNQNIKKEEDSVGFKTEPRVIFTNRIKNE